MNKILTLALIALFAANFANASTVKGGNVNATSKVKTSKSAKASKNIIKDFSIKGMQDTKNTLVDVTPAA